MKLIAIILLTLAAAAFARLGENELALKKRFTPGLGTITRQTGPYITEESFTPRFAAFTKGGMEILCALDKSGSIYERYVTREWIADGWNVSAALALAPATELLKTLADGKAWVAAKPARGEPQKWTLGTWTAVLDDDGLHVFSAEWAKCPLRTERGVFNPAPAPPQKPAPQKPFAGF